MAEMVQGQLYRVGLTCIAAQQRAQIELLVVASSNDDAKAKLPWVYDLSEYDSYRVDFTVKEPGRCCVLKIKYTRVDVANPDINIERAEGSQGFIQSPPPAGKKWQVIARTVCYAHDASHASKKLAMRIEGGSDYVQWAAEEIASASPFATARDVSMYPRASIVRG